MPRLLHYAASWIVASSVVSAAQFVRAADPPSPESQAAAKQVLGQWFTGLKAAKSLSAEMDASLAVKQDGKDVQSDATTYRFASEGPHRFAVVVTKGDGVTVIADGKQTYEYLAARNSYQIKDAPTATLDDSQLVQYANFGQGLGLVGAALTAASVDELVGRFDSVAFVGEEDKGGVKTQHLRIVQQRMPIEVWFSADASRLLQFSPDMKTGLTNAGQQLPPNIDVAMNVVFKNWAYDAAASADAFKIAPPAGAEQVDDLFAPPPHPLLGEKAPAFDTTELDGKPIKFAELSGKVVVLDFWATWCGPCVRALPAITETAAKFKDKGVVFYAVNQGEEASIIKEFLAAQKLTAPVAMDLEGKVGTAYGVEGIPQTVVIDKNGKIQVIHVGAGDGIGAQLTKELEAVLAGKDLADEKLKKKKSE